MVIPSEYEKYSGEVFDPIDALDEIEKANAHINKFIEDMRSGNNPETNLDSLSLATDVLGLYAGYPSEAANMEGYIKSELAVSYIEVADLLIEWSAKMNALIKSRLMNRPKG
ncbi:hypothetical protein [Reinekea thalattae]|uniref:Uncharacterized protein n=1 Tax=Reinekea thalattae TaxID=2593301 RepID=A0A5C8Z2F3_9GAMM|nr:hypothetical protein [Reinekea thalattae]TXR51411.1 hypothetical protein FME95_12865 [Reinekea thalattae]